MSRFMAWRLGTAVLAAVSLLALGWADRGANGAAPQEADVTPVPTQTPAGAAQPPGSSVDDGFGGGGFGNGASGEGLGGSGAGIGGFGTEDSGVLPKVGNHSEMTTSGFTIVVGQSRQVVSGFSFNTGRLCEISLATPFESNITASSQVACFLHENRVYGFGADSGVWCSIPVSPEAKFSLDGKGISVRDGNRLLLFSKNSYEWAIIDLNK